MRIAASVLAFLFVVAPFTASAAIESLDTLCKGSTGDPSGSATFTEGQDASVMDTFLKKKVLCPNACYNVTLTLSIEAQKLKIVISAVNKCTSPQPDASKIKSVFTPLEKPNEGRNCVSGKGLPSITAVTKALDPNVSGVPSFASGMVPAVFRNPKTVGPKSRCDQSANDVIAAFTQNGNKGLDVGLNKLAGLSGPSAVPEGSVTPPATVSDPGVTPTPEKPATGERPVGDLTSDNEALSKLLQEKYGVSEERANEIVQSDADRIQAIAMVEKSMSNDKEGAQAIAKSLNLNEDVQRNIANMEPPKQYTPEEAKTVYEEQQRQRESTFNEQRGQKSEMDRAKQAIANIESSGGRYDMLGPVTKSGDRAYGKYQVMGNNVGPWTEAALGYRMTPEQFRADPAAQEKVFEHRFGGYVEKYGSYENAAKVWFGGPGGLANQYRSDMLGTSVVRYGERFTAYFENGQVIGGGSRYSSSAFSGVSGGGGQYYNNYSGSPFGYDNSGYQGNYQTGYSTPTSYGGYGSGSNSGWSQVFSYFSGSGSQAPPSQPSRQVYYPTQSVQAVASIIAQPQQAYVGNSIVISWSSVGMRADAPCRTLMLTKNSTTTIGTTNEGSRIVTATSSGLMRFLMECKPLSGGTVRQATAVGIQ